ncbi:hypothetical protein [Massilia sp. 9I]|uniref:hypothetical protein n=1 Tax=Massilia sp. 9I TaxID=2653152 RepID=UPI0012F33234|nr:hypothetical protein [Massilia sp. 9I]VXB38931.1 exported hypothetical protein [Massilia sp. 9I]
MKYLPLLALLAFANAGAATLPQSGRLTLDVKIDGTGLTRGNKGKATFKTAETVHLAFTVHPVAGLEAINRLDEAGTQQAIQQVSAPAQARMPSEADAQRMAAQMQKEAAACGSNVACLQRVGEKASRMTAAWTGAPAMPQPQEGRYLNFSGMELERCNMEYTARIDDSVDGSIDDVQGPVPYTEQKSADYKGGAREVPFLCMSMVTLDTKTDSLWVLTQFPSPMGQVTRLQGRDRRTSSPSDGIALQKDAMAWVFDQLRGKVQRSGSRKTTLRVPTTLMGQQGEQTFEVDMRWKFETK